MASGFEAAAMVVAQQTGDRVMELILAPINNQEMLWIAIPLFITTLFMTLYFGRYRSEEVGWDTLFGNTMIFLFIAIDMIKRMYAEDGGTLASLLENRFYLALTLMLMGASLVLMIISYFRLVSKRFANLFFSIETMHVSVYAIMSIVYAGVAADWITLAAVLVFLALIIIVVKIIRLLITVSGFEFKEARKAEAKSRTFPKTAGLSRK